MNPSEVNLSLVDQIRNRSDRFTLGGCGIRLAADYVRGVLSAVGTDGIVAFPDAPSLLKEAETRLVYRNDEMGYEPPMTSMPAIETYCKAIGVAVPPRTLMVFENIVTSSKEDRDGDELLSDGAIMDGKMPLLWHHMLPAVVGKMLSVREQSKHRVRASSAIMESPLGNDVANLIEFGALRISHGFRPLEFTPRDKGPGSMRGGGGLKGFRISRFEVLEQSVVSVPSNPDAEIIAWSRGKVHTPVVNNWCRSLYEQRAKVFQSGAVREIPLTLKIDIRPTFTEEAPQVGASVIQPAGPNVIVPDYSMGERVPEQGETFEERTQGVELSPDSIRDFIRVLTPGDLVAVEEKTEADVAQDSQSVYRGWNGRVVSIDEAGAAVEKTDGTPGRIELGGRYRALTRQPEPKPEESAMDMLHIDPQPAKAHDASEAVPTKTQVALGQDAASQASEGHNPPNWAVDEELWERAKTAAAKTYDEGDEAFWPVVVTIYQNMGGTIQGKEAKQPAGPEEKAMKKETDADTKAAEEKPVKPVCPKCGEAIEPDAEKCEACGATIESEEEPEDEVQTKAGRALSAANQAALQTALEAIRTILEQVEPPAAPSEPKAVPEPEVPDNNTMKPAAPETTANKPTPVDLYKPDGATNIQAACQAILFRLFDPIDSAEAAMLSKLSDAIVAKNKSIDRAKRHDVVRKLFRKR